MLSSTARRLVATQARSARSAMEATSLAPAVAFSAHHLYTTSVSGPRAPTLGGAVVQIPSPPIASAAAAVAAGSAFSPHQQIRYRSNRSRRGLYDGKDIRTGNNVPFSMKKTKRKFKPNVFKKSVYSEMLDEMVRFHITTSALRSIDKAGGLDNYLLTSRHVTSGEGLKTKQRILKKMAKDAKKKAKEEEAAGSTADEVEVKLAAASD